MSKNILVTGGSGYIGSHTVLQLLNGGYSAVVVDNLDNSSAVSLERVKKIAGQNEDRLSFHQVSFVPLLSPWNFFFLRVRFFGNVYVKNFFQ